MKDSASKKSFFRESVRGFYVKRNKIMTMAGPIMEKREVELAASCCSLPAY